MNLVISIVTSVSVLIGSVTCARITCRHSFVNVPEVAVKVKASSYIAQYPVLGTAQSALHFTSITEKFTVYCQRNNRGSRVTVTAQCVTSHRLRMRLPDKAEQPRLMIKITATTAMWSSARDAAASRAGDHVATCDHVTTHDAG